MSDDLDLDAYFRRIGYAGPRTPTLETLRAIHRLHPMAIPFEGLDPFTSVTPALDLASLQAKMVHGRRGGYCFEQNSLLQAVLEALGFKLSTLIGRVVWMRPEGLPMPPPSHMGLRVELPEGVFLADAAFGGNTMTGPIRLEPHLEQDTPHGKVRLMPHADGYESQSLLGPEWRSTYIMGLTPKYPADFELSNWWTATHPTSIFVNNLIVTIVGEAERHALLNRNLTRRPVEGPPESRRIEDAADLAQVLDEVFNIAPPVPVESFFERLPVA
ncbi:MAG TPA: arylamine N-acetyltransferase [Caulobacteraceae bacterium]